MYYDTDENGAKIDTGYLESSGTAAPSKASSGGCWNGFKSSDLLVPTYTSKAVIKAEQVKKARAAEAKKQAEADAKAAAERAA